MSDILIKDMEMPREKKTTLTIFPDGRVYENHGERLWGHGEDCIPWKAIPVPPHGRLGDLDKLADNMRSATAGMEHRAIIMHEIRRAPTILPAEEGET